MPSSIFLAMLVVNGIISHKEADFLGKELATTRVPETWEGVINQLESLLNRKIIER